MSAAVLLAILLSRGVVEMESPREVAYPASGSILDAGLTPQHVIAADFDGDGLLDLAVATVFDDRVSIHRQTSDGNFELLDELTVGLNTFPSAETDLPRYLHQADVNRDGHPDLIVLCSGDFFYGAWPSVQTLLNRGDGTMAALAPQATATSFTGQHFPVHFATGHFNGDRYLDLVVANADAQSLRIMHGDGTGNFTIGPEWPVSVSGHGPQAVLVLDSDGDGRDDLIALTARGLRMLQQESVGFFGDPVAIPFPGPVTGLRSMLLEDYDADGRPELLVVENTGKVFLFHGLGADGNCASTTELTHPSFTGSTDVQTLHWDGDAIPDILVVNRSANTVSVHRSTGVVDVISTAMLPRRASFADLDLNGRTDLFTINEGDQINPANTDLSIAGNPHESLTAYRAEKISELPLGASLGVRIPRPAGVSGTTSGQVWVLENNRRAIKATTMSRANGTRVTFPMQLGGLHITGNDGSGFVVERDAPHLLSLDQYGNTTLLKKFSHNAGPVGYSGLARSPTTGYFYVGSPGTSEIVVLSAGGDFLDAFPAVPATDLTWDPATSCILAVHGGRSDVRAYSPAGVHNASASRELTDYSTFFAESGIAGIAVDPAKNERYVLGAAGMLSRWSSGWAMQESTTIAPVSSTRAMTYLSTTNQLLTVGDDAQLAWINVETGTLASLAPLWPLLSARPLFIPSGVCSSNGSSRIYVGSAAGPITASFTLSGTYLDSTTYEPIMAQPVGRMGGLAISKGTLLSRGSWHTVNTSDGACHSLPSGAAMDMSIEGDWLLAPIGNASEFALQSVSTGQPVANFTLDGAARTAGVAFRDETHFYRLTDGPAGPSLQLWRLRGTANAGENWDLYE